MSLKWLNNIIGGVLCDIALRVFWSEYLRFPELYQLMCSLNFIGYSFLCSFPHIIIYISCMIDTIMGVVGRTYLFLFNFNPYISNIYIWVQNSHLPSQTIYDHMFSYPDYILHVLGCIFDLYIFPFVCDDLPLTSNTGRGDKQKFCYKLLLFNYKTLIFNPYDVSYFIVMVCSDVFGCYVAPHALFF